MTGELLISVWVFGASVLGGLEVPGERLEAEGQVYGLGEILYEEDFESSEASGYWVEGNPEQVRVEDGRLILDGNVEEAPVVTAFIDREFEGNLYFAYRAEILASSTARGYPEPKNVNNLNTFIHYSDPSGRDLKETREERGDGAYRHYQSLNGYIVTFLNGYLAKLREEPEMFMEIDTGRIRLRENPGFVLREEAFREKSVEGRSYLLQFIYDRGELLFFIDNVFQLSFTASETHRFDRGYFAFRTFATRVAVDGFEVRRIQSVAPAGEVLTEFVRRRPG